jgi:predicted metal-binding protein
VETLLARALELGAEKAKDIDPASVVVEEWVVWKCQYGCGLWERDDSHPPCAPSPERTRKLLAGYSHAILLNGSDARKLSEVALRLEGEAYQAGHYKAFAMVAVSAEATASPATGEEAPCAPRKPSRGVDTTMRPRMEACGIDVYKTARNNGFEIDTRRETHGRWNRFALLLVE